MSNYAITGVGGYVAARHLKAISQLGGQLICALDPNDSVGILDTYFPDALFFTSDIRFERHLEKIRLDHNTASIEYLSVCSPNFIHDSHIRMGLRAGADVICEKPLVISPWNLDLLRQIEAETSKRVYSVLQLRYHPVLQNLKTQLNTYQNHQKTEVVLTYITRRGHWYHISWKGQDEKSGGLAMNIGVHFFDILIWLFGSVQSAEIHLADNQHMAGRLELERATVRWFLSIDYQDLPESIKEKNGYAYRSIEIDGQELEFSGGFENLHTIVYQEIIKGNGFGIDAAQPSIDLIYMLRQQEVVQGSGRHPMLDRR